MKLKNVQVVTQTWEPGSFDLRSGFAAGDYDIEWDEATGIVTVTSPRTGKVRLVPFGNVASMEPLDADEEQPARVRKGKAQP